MMKIHMVLKGIVFFLLNYSKEITYKRDQIKMSMFDLMKKKRSFCLKFLFVNLLKSNNPFVLIGKI